MKTRRYNPIKSPTILDFDYCDLGFPKSVKYTPSSTEDDMDTYTDRDAEYALVVQSDSDWNFESLIAVKDNRVLGMLIVPMWDEKFVVWTDFIDGDIVISIHDGKNIMEVNVDRLVQHLLISPVGDVNKDTITVSSKGIHLEDKKVVPWLEGVIAHHGSVE